MSLRFFLPVFVCLPMLPAAAVTLASTAFNTAGNPDGWAAVNGTTLNSSMGQLQLTNATGVTRATLAFDSVTVGTPGDYVEVSYDVIFTNSTSGVNRQFETSFWDSASSDGYVGNFRIGTVAANNRFFESASLSGTSVASTGATLIAATGDTTVSLRPTATNNSFVHAITMRLEVTGGGLALTYRGLDNGGVTRTITATDVSTPYLTFDRLDLNTWGNNNVNFTIDNVTVTTNVPEPSFAFLGGLGILGLLRRRRA